MEIIYFKIMTRVNLSHNKNYIVRYKQKQILLKSRYKLLLKS